MSLSPSMLALIQKAREHALELGAFRAKCTDRKPKRRSPPVTPPASVKARDYSLRAQLNCVHLGVIVDACPLNIPHRHIHACGHPRRPTDLCTPGPDIRRPEAPSCLKCDYYDRGVFRWDETSLFPHLSGLRFNPSIVEWDGGYAFAWRTGWRGSEIHLARLTRDLHPLDVRKLNLWHRDADYGVEDPRLFVHHEQLHVSYSGVAGGNRIRHTNVLYARLNAALEVEAVHRPLIPGRNSWEKNHTYFSHDGQLFAVYSIAPHRILAVDGGQAQWAYETATPAPWSGGHLRGGAAPIRVGDEYYCFFHGKTEDPLDYSVGCYTFEAWPPFRVLRITADPILRSHHATKPADQYCPVIFPGGAVRRNDHWLLACGIHDRWTELHRVDAELLERQLVPINPPEWFGCRPGTNDEAIWRSVVARDEYGLGTHRFADGDVVIDVGAHVGSFAHAVWRRGARRIVSIEADPENYAALVAHAAHMNGVEPRHAAAWPGPPATMHVQRPRDGDDNLGGRWVSVAGDGPAVGTVDLDQVLRDHERVAFLKLDIEGAELHVLQACTELGRVRRIALEYHDRPHVLAELLMAAGFTVRKQAAAGRPHTGWMFGQREAK